MVELTLTKAEITEKKQATDRLWKIIREETAEYEKLEAAYLAKYEEQEKQFEDFEQYIRALENVANKEFGRMRE